MPIERNVPDASKFNEKLSLPYELRLKDFELAMQDVYDFFYDVNRLLVPWKRISWRNPIRCDLNGPWGNRVDLWPSWRCRKTSASILKG